MPKVQTPVTASQKYVIDCSGPANDEIFDVAAFEKYLNDRVKVEGRTNNLGKKVSITRDDKKITITTEIAVSKRYFKYLSKKFLKKQQLRDWLRVISTDKETFTLKYFNINNDGAEEEADEE